MAAQLASDNTQGLPQLCVKGLSLTGDPQLAHRLKIGGKEVIPELLERALIEKGWEEYDPKQQGPDGWNVTWQSKRFGQSEHLACKPWQRLNHFPGFLEITHKDGLVRAMRRLQSQDHTKNKSSHFIPESFVLPREYTKLIDVIDQRRRTARQPGDDVWIYKPACQSRGRGISVFREVGQWQGGNGVAVVQHYIRPLLIGGFKFDLRLYVVVASFKPLVAYIYQDFLVRFATERYDLYDLKNVYSHLTNTSINTKGPGYKEPKSYIGTGCKWNMQQLCIRFNQLGIDDRLLWQRMTDIVILTLLCQEAHGGAATSNVGQNCVELFGFDILIDENYQPWLLEVNESPSLANDCEVDEQIKIPMLCDLMDLMKLKDSDRIPRRLPRGCANQRQSHHRLASYPRASTACQKPAASSRTILRSQTRASSRDAPTVLGFVDSPLTEDRERAGKTAVVCAQTSFYRWPASTWRKSSCQKTTASGCRSFRPERTWVGCRSSCQEGALTCRRGSFQEATLTGRRNSCQARLPSRLGSHTPEPPNLFAGNFALVFPFNKATIQNQSICFVLDELRQKEEEMHSVIDGSPFDWSNRPRTYPFAMHQEPEWLASSLA